MFFSSPNEIFFSSHVSASCRSSILFSIFTAPCYWLLPSEKSSFLQYFSDLVLPAGSTSFSGPSYSHLRLHCSFNMAKPLFVAYELVHTFVPAKYLLIHSWFCLLAFYQIRPIWIAFLRLTVYPTQALFCHMPAVWSESWLIT